MPILRRLTRRTAGDLVIEVVLIVLGITCALWFDGAKDARDERRLEESILREMARTLESDTADFRIAVDGLATVAASIDSLDRHLSERRDYQPELDRWLGDLTGAFGLFPNHAAYEDLRSAGLRIIRNDSLRQQVVQYYDFQLQAARIIEEMRVFPYRTNVLLPQLTEKLAFTEGPRPRGTPRDYPALRDDVEYLNALRLWRAEIALQSRKTEEAYRGATALLKAIEGELAPG
jgi:hypothetical protein